MPELRLLATPQRTKPNAKAGYDGNSVHAANPAPLSSALATSRARRETTSARAPDGTSKSTAVADQITNSEEIWLVDRPCCANSTA